MLKETDPITQITEARNETADFFGEGFKEKTFFDSTVEAFGEELKAIESGEQVSRVTLEDGREITGIVYRYNDREKLIFSWNAGIGDNSTYYMIADKSGIISLEDGTTVLDVEDFGLATEKGKVARIGVGVKSKIDKLNFRFSLGEPKDAKRTARSGNTFTKIGGEIATVETDHTINASPPLYRGEWNVLMHELGHVLTEDYLSNVLSPKELLDYTSLKLKTIGKMQDYIDNGGFVSLENIMDYQERKWLAWSERKANALALQLGRVIEENLNLGRNSLSDKEKLQSTISTYEGFPYDVTSTPTSARIPSFEKNSRANARTLQGLIHTIRGGSYNQQKNFDDQTGEHIGNNPAKQIESILES